MTYTFQNLSEEVIDSYLKSAKTIAIVGLSHRKETSAYQVAHFLKTAGYRIVPVNPKLELPLISLKRMPKFFGVR